MTESDDGADLGFTAEQGLNAAIGGEQPKSDTAKTPAQMRVYLELAPDGQGASYDDAARYAGKVILAFLDKHPEHAELEAYSKYDWPEGAKDGILVSYGIRDVLERDDPESNALLNGIGLSGFMFGWAVNAAKFALGKPHVHNPAIVTIET